MVSVVSGCVEGCLAKFTESGHLSSVEEGFSTTVPTVGHVGQFCSCWCHWPLVVPWGSEDSQG